VHPAAEDAPNASRRKQHLRARRDFAPLPAHHLKKKSHPGWKRLATFARRLRFETHDIGRRLDSTGHYALPFHREFPFSVRLFHYRAGRFTQGVTWHEQLELFCPITGRVDVQMGSQLVRLAAGDLLVMDNLKLHHVVDRPDLDARVVVVSFLPELVYSLGSLSHDFAFLQYPQQLGLHLERDVTDLVEEQCAAVRQFEPAGPGFERAG
jgi:hypothetical protein